MSDKIKLVADEQTIEKLKQKQERRRNRVKSVLPKEPIQSPDANNELIEVLNQLKESLNKPPHDQPEHDKKKDEQQKPNDESQKQRDEEIQRIRDEEHIKELEKEVERKKLFESIVQRHNSLVERFNQIVELKDDRIKELENEIKRVLERREIANAAAEKPQEDINHVLQEVIDKKKPIMKNYSKPTQSSIKKK
jgi:hypothetical protein